MSNTNTPVDDPRDLFSLNRIHFLLDAYGPPEGPIDPKGAWDLTYDHYTLGYWNFRPQGELRVQRRPYGEDKAGMRFDSKRIGRTGYHYFVRAEATVGTDPAASHLRWTAETKIAQHGDAPAYLQSGLRKEGNVEAGRLTVYTGKDQETTPIPGPYVMKWALVDVVQRLPRAASEPVSFSLVDEVDEVRGNQSIAFRTQARLQLKNGPQTLTAYQHIGEGVIPTVYWVDEGNRVLLIVTGVEAFVLRKCKTAEADFDPSPFVGKSMHVLLRKEA